MMPPPELESRNSKRGESVEPTFRNQQVENRESVRPEQLRPAEPEPAEDLSFRLDQSPELRYQVRFPRSRRDDESIGAIGATVGSYPDPRAFRAPIQHSLFHP